MNRSATADPIIIPSETLPIPPCDFAKCMEEAFFEIQSKVQGLSHLLEPYAQGAPFTRKTAQAVQGCLDSLAGEVEEYAEFAYSKAQK